MLCLQDKIDQKRTFLMPSVISNKKKIRLKSDTLCYRNGRNILCGLLQGYFEFCV